MVLARIAIVRSCDVSNLTETRFRSIQERKSYKERKKSKRTSKLISKVTKKAEDRQRIWLRREIGSYAGMSH